jgi:hypothetical protein
MCRVMMGEPEGRSSLGRAKRRWEDTCKMDFRQICWEVVECIRLARDRDQAHVLVKAVLNPRVA